MQNEICDKITGETTSHYSHGYSYISPVPFPLVPPHRLAMAFSNYSDLFKSGLLTDDSSPARYRSEPWAKEYLGPRRGSAPGSIAESVISTPLPSASVAETNTSIVSGESFYFTFKKRRNPSMYRSFLSLDLAESQSLRSASLRAKESMDGMSSRYLSATVFPSYVSLPEYFLNISHLYAAFLRYILLRLLHHHPRVPLHSIACPTSKEIKIRSA